MSCDRLLFIVVLIIFLCFFFQAEDGIRDVAVTGVQTCALPIFYEVSDGALVMVVIARLFLELRHNATGIFVGPVSQHHHVVAIVLKRFRFFRIDDDWTVNACLLLQTRVAVIPVGSVLMKLEFVFVHAIGCDAMEAQARHTVHVGG